MTTTTTKRRSQYENETAARPVAFDGDRLLRQIGVAVVTGALTLSMIPTAALAENSSASSTNTGSTTSNAQPQAPSGDSQGSSTPPAPPSGGSKGTTPNTQGQPPSDHAQPPSGSMSQGQPPAGGMGGANTQSFDYTGSYTGALTADGEEVRPDGNSVSATESDQNALLAKGGGTLVVTGASVDKSGDDNNGDNCNFYGLNSIALSVGNGSLLKISNSKLNATSEGSNGVFSTDSATAYMRDSSITTSAGNSRGFDATYGGTILADTLDISTQGDHSAGVATDRGGGNISLTNSTIKTAGSGSPLLYSTGDIELNNVTGSSSGSQIAGMEGLNTILINNSTLESTQSGKTASDPIADGIIIYQSTSGDAETATGKTATFQAVGSTLKSAITSGSMFYFTNTKADVVLKDTTLDFDSTTANLILAAGNSSNNWGSAGSNGAAVSFTGISQTLSGAVEADTISSVKLYLTSSTTWTGTATVRDNESAIDSAKTEAPITVNVDASSTWVVNGDSTVTNLAVADGGRVVDTSGTDVTIKDASGAVLREGSSTVTLTVTGSYSTSYDADGAGSLSSDLIDRSAFDNEYSTSTAFTLGADAQTSASSSAHIGASASTEDSGQSWWDAVVSWFKGLFGLS